MGYESGTKVSGNPTAEHTRTFVYDTTASIPAVIAEDAVVPANGVYYIREPGGELLAMIDPVAGIRYYHFDQLGSTRLLTDADGDVTDDYAYDAYGALLAHNRHADSLDQPYQYVGQLGYYTHCQEPGFGLLQLAVRFYDAGVGRLTQLGSPYTFAGNNPTGGSGGTIAEPPTKPAPPPDLTKPPVKGIPELPPETPGLGARILPFLGRVCVATVGVFLASETTCGDGTISGNPETQDECAKRRKGLKTGAKTLEEHVRKHYHPDICKKKRIQLQEFYRMCYSFLDNDADSSFCTLLKAFRKLCVGKSSAPDFGGPPFTDPYPWLCK